MHVEKKKLQHFLFPSCCELQTEFPIWRVGVHRSTLQFFGLFWVHLWTHLSSQNIKYLGQKDVIWDTATGELVQDMSQQLNSL